MSARRHEQPTRTFCSDRRVLDLWLLFCGAGGFETDGGDVLVVVEGDAAIAGVSGPQRAVCSGWLACSASVGSNMTKRSRPQRTSIPGTPTTLRRCYFSSC